MVLVQVKTTAYQGNLQNCLIYAPPSEPFVPSVGFYFPVGPLGLYGTIHAEQCAMNAVQVIENLFVERSQFIVQTNDSVMLAFVAFGSVWAAAAIFALVYFQGPPILVPFYRLCSKKEELFFVRTHQPSFFVYPKIYGTVWIVTILLVLTFLFEHWKFHVYNPPFFERHRRGYETCGLSHVFRICYNIHGEFGILQNPWR